jgi:hypothetical protein
VGDDFAAGTTRLAELDMLHCPVTNIGNRFACGARELERVVLPRTVRSIGDDCCANATAMVGVHARCDALTVIGRGFASGSTVQEIAVVLTPDGLCAGGRESAATAGASIGDDFAKGATSLTDVYLGVNPPPSACPRGCRAPCAAWLCRIGDGFCAGSGLRRLRDISRSATKVDAVPAGVGPTIGAAFLAGTQVPELTLEACHGLRRIGRSCLAACASLSVDLLPDDEVDVARRCARCGEGWCVSSSELLSTPEDPTDAAAFDVGCWNADYVSALLRSVRKAARPLFSAILPEAEASTERVPQQPCGDLHSRGEAPGAQRSKAHHKKLR